jgi:transcriptional regulator with XRE-family HTH domain
MSRGKTPVPSTSVHHLEICHAALGSDRAISAILGVSPSQLSRWRRGQTPDVDNADRLAGLALVVEMLSRWLAPETLEGWLYGVHAHLGDRSPTYLIGQGRVADVIGAIEAEKAGVYA